MTPSTISSIPNKKFDILLYSLPSNFLNRKAPESWSLPRNFLSKAKALRERTPQMIKAIPPIKYNMEAMERKRNSKSKLDPFRNCGKARTIR